MGEVIDLHKQFYPIDGPFGIDAIEILDGPFFYDNGTYIKYRMRVRRWNEWEEKILPVSWIKAVWDRQNRVDIFQL